MSDSSPKIYHNTVFWYCNDIVAMRRFYSELLGMEETYFDEQAGWLTYSSGTLQVVFIRASETLPLYNDWARQPAYHEGKINVPSWVIQTNYDDFDAIIARIQAGGDIPTLENTPREPQPGDKAFWVRDPMGITIEVYATKDKS